NENGRLLSDFQNTFRDFLNELRLESLLPLHGTVNLVDWEAFLFGHSFYSVVTELHPKHLAAMANFRDEALYRQANFLGPVAKIIYSFRHPTGEGLGVALSSVLVADDIGGATWRITGEQHSSPRPLIRSLVSISR